MLVLQNGEVSFSNNHPDPDMTEVEIPEDFLSSVFLGRSNYDYKFYGSSPQSQYTDLNIWNKFLGEEELVAWTTCQ